VPATDAELQVRPAPPPAPATRLVLLHDQERATSELERVPCAWRRWSSLPTD
jgi:hypothetical protein